MRLRHRCFLLLASFWCVDFFLMVSSDSVCVAHSPRCSSCHPSFEFDWSRPHQVPEQVLLATVRRILCTHTSRRTRISFGCTLHICSEHCPSGVTLHLAQGYVKRCVVVLRMSSISTSRFSLRCFAHLRLFHLCYSLMVNVIGLQSLTSSRTYPALRQG